eukprot:scaffold100_cov162-Ochromonas_danica.AAC.6
MSGNPQYDIVMESYPFVARKPLGEDRRAIQLTEYDDNSKYFKLLQEFGKGYRFTKNGSGCDIRNRSLVNLYPLPNSCNSLKYRRTHQSETLQHRTSVPPQQRRQFSKTKRSNDF